jgi:hypothetical protein
MRLAHGRDATLRTNSARILPYEAISELYVLNHYRSGLAGGTWRAPARARSARTRCAPWQRASTRVGCHVTGPAGCPPR